MILDISAQRFSKAYPLIKVLMKSNPPRKMMSPKITTICINNFFFDENFIAKYEKITKGKPKKDGI